MINEEQLIDEAYRIRDSVIEIRRDLHMHPELGDEEVRTSGVIKSVLGSLGIENKSAAGTGVAATIYGCSPEGPTIGIRADMDALPVQDRKSTAYSSKISGKMHACGHDAHTAILLGTAMVLNKFKDKLPGNVRFIFQPAEETTGGADRMIKEGALENPRVNAVIGLHMDENIPSGCIGIKYGQMNAASNPFEITIKGKGAHGAAPHDGVDAIAISAQVVSALQTIVSRETDPTDSAVVTIGMINGGNAPNIICDTVVLKGIIRTLNNTLRTNVQNRLCQVVNGITESMMGSAKIKIDESYPCLINDDAMTDLLKKSASEILGNDKIVILNRPSLGVEDFAYFGQHVPSVFYRLGCRNEEKGIIHPAHGCFFDIDEDSLLTGVLVHCQTVIKYLFK